jgi:hypothetical protein
MMYLRRVALSSALISVLAIAALAGETGSPPAPCVPGETGSPPCSSQSINDGATNQGQTETPPASNAVDLVAIAETALMLLF